MLNDATCFKAVYIVCGYIDLRSGMDWLAALAEAQTDNKPYVPESRFQWPRSPEQVRSLTKQQFRWLIEGLTIAPKKSVRPMEPPEYMG